jgi:hypothetical protein
MFCQKASLFALAIARCTFLRKVGSPISALRIMESNRLTQYLKGRKKNKKNTASINSIFSS